jgi:hypothetical protein
MVVFFDFLAWADNADVISMQYSGTGALKTDYTRTGKRGFFGILKDVSNSSVRYFKNHYQDGFKQDSFDLFLGVYRVPDSTLSPFSETLISKNILFVINSLILKVLIFGIIGSLCFLLLWLTKNDVYIRVFLSIIGIFSSLCALYVFKSNARDFVSLPLLNQLNGNKEHYL